MATNKEKSTNQNSPMNIRIIFIAQTPSEGHYANFYDLDVNNSNNDLFNNLMKSLFPTIRKVNDFPVEVQKERKEEMLRFFKDQGYLMLNVPLNSDNLKPLVKSAIETKNNSNEFIGVVLIGNVDINLKNSFKLNGMKILNEDLSVPFPSKKFKDAFTANINQILADISLSRRGANRFVMTDDDILVIRAKDVKSKLPKA